MGKCDHAETIHRPGHQSTRRERGFKRRVKRQLPSITGHYQTGGSPGTMGVLLRGNYTPASHQTQAHRHQANNTDKYRHLAKVQTSCQQSVSFLYKYNTDILLTSTSPHQTIKGNLSASQSLAWKTLNCIKFYDI